MTVKKRLARSHMAMLAIPILTAGVLLLLTVGALLFLLRENLLTLHDALEQAESILHGFKLTICAYLAAAVLLVLLTVALTSRYLTRNLFRHISEPLDALTAGVARIRDGNLDAPIAYTEADEFKAACDAVDEMAARLKASLEQEQTERQKKQELIVGMSHDLKSPLTSVRAYTEALLDGVAKDEETRLRYLQTIYAKEADMEALVNRLFAFAKTDTSAYPLHTESLPLLKTVHELTDVPEADGMEIQTDISPELRVLADRELLSRIFGNLLGNSRKYGGKPCMHVQISAEMLHGMAEIRYADDGAGVPAEQLPRLFDAFYRGDAARTAPGAGSGLGLTVVKNAVVAMGGSVCAETASDGGLRIVFTLPAEKEKEKNDARNTDY